MPVLHINDQQYPLQAGPTRLGAPDAAEIPVAVGVGVQAIVEVENGRGATIRRAASDAAIRVNGVALGAEPTPLLHGDRLEIAGIEIRYADDQKAGATQFVSSGEVEALASKRSGAAVATSGTGGRLVSLVDGKEYAVPATGLVIGREVGADVVVPLAEVSRRHAEIVPTGEGYRLTDLSTNGVLVNGERVEQSRVLNRSDVIRVGSEEFRFYADIARPRSVAGESDAAAAEQPVPAAAAPVAGRDVPGSPAPGAIPGATPGAPVAAEPVRPAVAPLTAGPSPAAAPPRRPAPKPQQPAPAAGGGVPRLMWLVLLLAVVLVAYVVTS